MPRLFISHSSKDNVQALAFQRWLMVNGWSEEDVFIDLHGIGAGERWRDTLRKASTSCEAVTLLASPASLDSKECQREMNLAEDLGKEIIVAILRDLKKDDPRLVRYADRQFVDLSTEPTERMDAFEWEGKVQRVEFHLPALQRIKARLAHLGIAPGSFSWTPKPGAGPYPGLAVFTEDDAAIFFGREADIMAGITELRTFRKRRSPRLLVIQAASGAGKSSFLRAGLWPRLARDPDFAPLCILRPALGILTGPDGVGRKVSAWFQRYSETRLAGDIHTALANKGDAAFVALIEDATRIATVARRAGAPEARPPAALIAIDQGEELFAPENETESQRFLDFLAALLREPPEGVDPYALITIRADSVEALLQRGPALGLDTPKSLYLPPLSPAAYRDVILKPAAVYSERVRRLIIEPALAEALIRDAVGADALPLLAFTLEKLFFEFGASGELSLERYNSMGGIGGSIDRALAEAQRKTAGSGGADNLRRLIIPGLATWDPAAGAAKRLIADEAELTGGERRSLAPLANTLVEARLLTRDRDTLEVAHEALLRRPPIDGWLAEQKDALKLRDDVLREAKEWESGGKQADFVRRGTRLEAALELTGKADYAPALAPAKAYLAEGQRLEAESRKRARRTIAAIFLLMIGVIASLLGVIFKAHLGQLFFQLTTERNFIASQVRPLSAEVEKTIAGQPGKTFHECDKNCPEMVVLPIGSFWMGSPDSEGDSSEHPRHQVRIDYPLAVGKYTVTWDEYELCVAMRGCDKPSGDFGLGRGKKPVINMSWKDAQNYVAWLSRMTGKPYRLLSEAEWEYAARGITTIGAPHPKYFWGDDDKDICAHANLADQSFRKHGFRGDIADCDDKFPTTAPVGQFPANAFGLHDMAGNVWQWVEDNWHDNYAGTPPADGSVWKGGDQTQRVLRGGSWYYYPRFLRAAGRDGYNTENRGSDIGFRVARTLFAP